jgi:hypothetical protein
VGTRQPRRVVSGTTPPSEIRANRVGPPHGAAAAGTVADPRISAKECVRR